MAESEAFTVITSSSHHNVFEDYEEINSAHGFNLNTAIQAALRRQYPELNLTVTTAKNVPLLQFAALGNATAELDITTDSVERMRYFYEGSIRSGTRDRIADSRTFAKYHYRWASEDFILYVVFMGGYSGSFNFILKEPGKDETTNSHCAVTDALIFAVGQSFVSHDENFIYVYDSYWSASRSLWEQVQKARWEDVILNEQMKKTLTELMTKFFDSKDIYRDFGVPWKRGVIFHGPAGNGKTISIKALMHSLSTLHSASIPALYVKSAPRTVDIRNVFQKARYMAPCMLILEDIDTIVTENTRSYFFNEVDGLENNDGIFMVASTNHLDKLDPGLSKRPSRFDRKYLFPLPSEEERIMYCEYWRQKLKNKPAIKFPQKLSPAIAGITEDFSFAYLKEAFVSTLLVIAGHRSDEIFDSDEDDRLDDYELWREMKNQVKLLREDMDNTMASTKTASAGDVGSLPHELRPSTLTHSIKHQGGLRNKCRMSMPISLHQHEPRTLGSHTAFQQPESSFQTYHNAHTLNSITDTVSVPALRASGRSVGTPLIYDNGKCEVERGAAGEAVRDLV